MRASVVALIAALATPAAAEELVGVGTFDWITDSIAELSGLEITGDGARFTAVSDRGFWVSGRFVRDGDAIAEVEIDDIDDIKGIDGYPVSARRIGDWSDAEGLAISADGTAWISFERWAHVSRHPEGVGGAGQWIEDHPTFYDHAENWQLEALALSPEGALYTFSEKPLPEGFPIYRLDGAAWTIDGYLPEQDLFSIVGADFDDDGDLYILERKLVVGLWWQNRIRRVRLDGSLDEALWTGERGEFGNLEGIAVWHDGVGVRLTLVTDNGGEAETPTQFVEFRLTE